MLTSDVHILNCNKSKHQEKCSTYFALVRLTAKFMFLVSGFVDNVAYIRIKEIIAVCPYSNIFENFSR